MNTSIELPTIRTSVNNRFLTEDGPRNSQSAENLGDIMDESSSRAFDEDVLADIHPRWRRDLYALLESPTSSSSAFVLHVSIVGLIIFSAIITVLETVPAFRSISPKFWFGIETSIVALFTIEYIARCLAWSSTWMSFFSWVVSFFGIVDILSVLPYYIEIILRQDTSALFRFSILRVFRLARIFRPFRYNHTVLLTMEVMYLSVRRSQHALFAIGFFVFMVLSIFSTLLYFAERGTWEPTLETYLNERGDPTQFSSIPAAAWFVLVTITTVGYGEITPTSFIGRLITLPLLLFGLLLIALPSFVLGREFSIVWENMTNKDNSPLQTMDGSAEDSPTTAFLPPNAALDRTRDLSNLKLAQNQTEISQQIQELKATVEFQSKIMQKLLNRLEATESKGKGRESSEYSDS